MASHGALHGQNGPARHREPYGNYVADCHALTGPDRDRDDARDLRACRFPFWRLPTDCYAYAVIILLTLLTVLEPMSPGIHTPHKPPGTSGMMGAARCLVAKDTSKNGLMTMRAWTPGACK